MPQYTLKAEMARQGLRGVDIARTLNITDQSAYNKINGRTEFTLKETIIIRDKYFPDMAIEDLFGDSDKQVS